MKDLPEDINWRLIISNLRRAGWDHSRIAYETGFTLAEVRQMEAEVYYPPYLSIIKLLDLHVSECPSKHHMIGIMYPESVDFEERKAS